MIILHLLLLLLIQSFHQVACSCPSNCNGHGTCTSTNTCSCFPGYIGFDCFARECPQASPWIDYAVADDDIRSTPRECSNMGVCDRNSGRCQCEIGFSGIACERLVAPCNGNCNGHGRCMNLKTVGPLKNDYNLFSTATYTTPWDAERVYGCVCDYGFTGPDCAQRICAYGDDPLTTGQVDEIQALSCLCNSCTGTFTLTFRGYTTRDLVPGVETAATLKEALEDLVTIRSVTVTLDGGTTICDSDGVSSLITFTHEHGDVPTLIVTSTLVGTNTVTVQADGATAVYGANAMTQSGTKEWLPCSNRGLCNTYTGVCVCDSGYESSDGLGGSGIINDCGYRSGGAVTVCSNSAVPCNGHGRCSGAPGYTCTCDNGFYGFDCSRRRCLKGNAWWEEPQSNDIAHMSMVECSNAGICDEIGVCRCFPGFEGVTCNRLSCPSNEFGVCSGRGFCKSVRELAALTPNPSFGVTPFVYGVDPNAVSTWDADMIRGCYCDKVHQKRGQDVRYNGYKCSKLPCPRGDDPWTSSQVDEVQSVNCNADGGSFTLTFRGETTPLIPATATAASVQSALLRLRTINVITVTFSDGISTACSAAGNVIRVTFISPSGNVPLMIVNSVSLTNSGGAVAISSTEVVAGTKEDTVCSNRGRCDEDAGTCICAFNHASSDGRGSYGVLDDCGAVDEFMTHGEL